jgi:hypothetical protein
MTEITEQLAIELTKNHLLNGQDEKPLSYRALPEGGAAIVLSDGRKLYFNRVEVEHAEIMIKNGGAK